MAVVKGWLFFLLVPVILGALCCPQGEAVPAIAVVTEPPPVVEPPSLSARAAVLMEWSTGTPIYGLRAHEKRDPASLTKIMTAILALERGSLAEPVHVSPHAAWMPGSVMGLEEGQEYALIDLLYGLMLESGNDAAVAIAEHIAGSEEAFARLMIEKARQLGAVSTSFRNPHGLTEPGHYTTAYDLALITRYAMSLPLFAQVVRTREKDITSIDDPAAERVLHNTNRLLWAYGGVEGVKTGTTEAAGPCLVTSATRDGMRLLTVVLDSGDRWGDTAALLDWGFANYSLVQRGRAGEWRASVRVYGGLRRTVELVLENDLAAVVCKSEGGQVEVKEEVVSGTRAPVRRGQPLGKLSLSVGERRAAETRLVARQDVLPRTPFWILWWGMWPILRLMDACGLLP